MFNFNIFQTDCEEFQNIKQLDNDNKAKISVN